ncbi:hypothetical protein B0H10DRAFT_1946753 [Mycena sp. CBHHK59/15]|nr:hypothetical protein B0H10DRAFT_1946753 [Mycena sp. CBHHK59/15]
MKSTSRCKCLLHPGSHQLRGSLPANILSPSQIIDHRQDLPQAQANVRKRAKDAVTSSLKEPLVFLDDGCFLTGLTCCSLEAVHIINAVRDKKDDMKAKVVAFLKDQLYIVHPGNRTNFSLESAANLILLYLPYYRHLNTYGTYVLIPSKLTLSLLIYLLNIANDAWARAVEKDNTWKVLTCSLVAFDLILLHPSAFLIGGQPMLAAGEPEIDPRTFNSEKFGFDALTPRQRELADLTMTVNDLIYYRPSKEKPRLVPGTTLTVPGHSSIDVASSALQADNMASSAATYSPDEGLGGDGTGSGGMERDNEASGSHGPDTDDSASDDSSGTFTDGSASDDLEEEDLTLEEADQILQRLQEGNCSLEDRIALAHYC